MLRDARARETPQNCKNQSTDIFLTEARGHGDGENGKAREKSIAFGFKPKDLGF